MIFSQEIQLLKSKIPLGLLKIIHNIGWLYLEKIISLSLTFLIGIAVVRYLGTESFGKLSYGLGFVGLFEAIAKLGLDAIVIRNLVKYPEKKNQILGTAFVLKLISSSLTVIAIAFLIKLISHDLQVQLLTIILSFTLVLKSWEVIDFWFQSQVASKLTVLVRSGQKVFNYGSKLILIWRELSLVFFAIIQFISFAFLAIGLIFIYLKKQHKIWQWQFDFSQAQLMLKDSLPLIFSGVMIAIYMNIDQVMLGILANIQEVGIYAAAVRFSEIWYFVPTAICASVFPAIIRAKQKSYQEYQTKIQQLYDLMAVIALIITVPLSFIATPVISFFLGQEYLVSGQILAIHIWASPFVFLGVARSNWLITENFTSLQLATTLLGALSNLVLNWYLIPLDGGKGAAIATVISYAISSHFSAVFYPQLWTNTWMLTKALFLPFRFKQNQIYWSLLKRVL